MKRLFDIFASALGLLLLAPLFAVAAVVIRWEDGGPVFFRQTRVGRHGREFSILKFRTMIVDAERRGPLLTVEGDSRITRVGRLLRKSKLDEFPQLWNVLIGEMSLVGPRPEVPRYVAYYSQQHRKILELRPGITDPASLEYFLESELLERADEPIQTYITKIMPAKLEINRRYAKSAGVMTDTVVILRTFLRMAGVGATSTIAESSVDEQTPAKAA